MKPLCFVLDANAAAHTPSTILTGEWRCQRLHEPQRFQRIYLDSLDWRLLRKNLYMIADKLGDEFRLHLLKLRDNQVVATATLGRVPDFAVSLPRGRIAATVGPILRQRALVTQIRLSVVRHPMAVIDRNDAIVAHLDLEVSNPQIAGSERTSHVHRRLWFVPVEGHERQNRAIVNTLSEYGVPMLNGVIPASYLVSALNIDINRFNGKPALKFAASDRADHAVKRLFGFLLAVMETNRHPVLADVDGECLHDFRVAVRRFRSLLGQSRDVIDNRRRERAKAFFARLNRVTSPQRDFDVMLENFDFYRSLLPARARGHLDTVHDYVVERRRAAAAITARAVEAANYQRFMQDWHTYLGAEVRQRTSLKRAAIPVKDFADARIWRAYKRVITDGGDITDDSPPEALHGLRKKCKTLRHLIEFFGSLYPEKKIKRILTLLKHLQDNLGAYQDLHVHIDLIDGVRKGLGENGQLNSAVDDAISKVVKALSRRQLECRNQFQQRFAAFGEKTHQQLYEQLFRR